MKSDQLRNLTRLLFAAVVLLVGGCRSNAQQFEHGAEPDNEFELADIGRNAANTTLSGLDVQRLIRDGKTEQALDSLNSSFLLQLALIRHFDAELANDDLHVRVRNKLVVMLQRQWLARPPRYLDDASAAFLLRICSTLPDCPATRIVPREPLPEFPE